MGISTYHIHNVLRTYSQKLKKIRQRANEQDVTIPKGEDWSSISTRTRRKAVIEKVTSDIVSRIIHKRPRNDVGPGVFRHSRDENRNGLSVEKGDCELTYKIIDKEKGKVTKTFLMETSEFLKAQLEEITENKAGH